MAVLVPKADRLGHIMSRPVRTVGANEELGAALEVMVKHDVGAVVVVEDSVAVGMLTERDITRQLVKNREVLLKPLKEVMSKPLVTATPTTAVYEAFELMLKNKIRRLPVLEGTNLVGIVTEKDLMRWILRISYEPNIPANIKAIIESK